MNIAFFLVPKHEVVCLTEQSTLRQALERMEYHRYTAVPVLSEEGRYIGTITEGDLLWFLKNTEGVSFDNAHRHHLSAVPMRMRNDPVHIDANMEDLITKAKAQNFVPVIDDRQHFIGLVRRSDIIEYCAKQLFTATAAAAAKE
ncbi:CBS domain-containing protein [Paenibacillus flagellatus]|uniref:CBS domain-containing protein n=1 Tax=Paenibacillus flagellatus TaxID=2211139 RepID=A0A2V5KCV9_9BACL|nr:CBS domain-containing protein [Paenibacillus flagellatus]PYI55813.1 CBS domain-containing protein [Paenibacillus flagellatus]